LKSSAEWFAYAKTLEKPNDIPANPKHTYEGDGWAGMGDWIGTGAIASQLREYQPFRNARAFARSLNLKSEAEWRAYVKSGKKPDDIPASPSRTYAKNGWSGMGDWRGTGRIAHTDRQFRPFKGSPRVCAKAQFEIWEGMAHLLSVR
jgi:Phage-integrase repeat unit